MDRGERRRRERELREAGRLPPGQALTERWPVLSTTGPPKFDPVTWRFRIGGRVRRPQELTYDEFLRLPHVEVHSDIHCVTRWSRLDNLWEGVSFRTLMDLAEPAPEAQ